MAKVKLPVDTVSLTPPSWWAQQSPIELGTSYYTDGLPPLKFHYTKKIEGTFEDDHNFHVLESERGKATVTFGKQTYELAKIHFHAPSEHTVDLLPMDFEAHLVHLIPGEPPGFPPKYFVVGVFYSLAAPNRGTKKEAPHLSFSQLISAQFKFTSVDLAENSYSVKPSVLIPKKHDEFYHYQGSLTTPDYTETVSWVVLREHGIVNTPAEYTFLVQTTEPARPIQPLNRRFVLRNFQPPR